MKKVLLFLLFLLLGFGIAQVYGSLLNSAAKAGKMIPVTTQFSMEKPPSESLQGEIASLSGRVTWISRTATKPVALKTQRAIVQGEDISTGDDGKVTIKIKNISQIALLPNSHVSVTQLLPQNFVFEQDKGLALYANTWQVPISVKSLDLVTIISAGVVSVEIDSKTKTVSVKAEKGIVKAGYMDSQGNSTVVPIPDGQTFIFNDTSKEGKFA